jgi:hypothetical protein
MITASLSCRMPFFSLLFLFLIGRYPSLLPVYFKWEAGVRPEIEPTSPGLRGATGCLLCDPLTENKEWDLMDPEERRTELAGFSFEGGINYIKARNIDYFF